MANYEKDMSLFWRENQTLKIYFQGKRMEDTPENVRFTLKIEISTCIILDIR